MTAAHDLDVAIAEIKRATPEGEPWHAGEFGTIHHPLNATICTVLNAVASGELVNVTELQRENSRLRAELTYATQYDTQDELTPLIHEDQRSPGYWGMYGTALEYVSNRKSKSALVHLVTFLLRRNEEKAL